MPKHYLNKNVYEASIERIRFTFDNFKKIIISFSGGKDSTVLTHLVMEEAIKRNVKVALFFIDWECQFSLTIDHVKSIYDTYKEYIYPYWVSLPLMTDNSCSMHEPMWYCWDENKKDLWVREKPEISIKDKSYFPFYYENITFEEFTPLFAEWYSNGELTANFIGIRTQESLNRFRAVSMRKELFKNKKYMTNISGNAWGVYPLYDWKTEDIWAYNGKSKNKYNTLYDRMYKAGLTIHQMRIDEPFGDTTRNSLWLYQIIEPEIWAKIVSRVSGANVANEYGRNRGNILGNQMITLPDGHTWKSFANYILDTMPPKTSEHYKNKIAKYLFWYKDKGYPCGIEDDAPIEIFEKVPSWKRVCKTLLKNDYWCRGLGFSITKSKNYQKYLDLMKRKRKEWNIYS